MGIFGMRISSRNDYARIGKEVHTVAHKMRHIAARMSPRSTTYSYLPVSCSQPRVKLHGPVMSFTLLDYILLRSSNTVLSLIGSVLQELADAMLVTNVSPQLASTHEAWTRLAFCHLYPASTDWGVLYLPPLDNRACVRCVPHCFVASQKCHWTFIQYTKGCRFLVKEVRETHQTERGNTSGDATKKREISRTSLPINLHFWVLRWPKVRLRGWGRRYPQFQNHGMPRVALWCVQALQSTK